MTTRRQQLHSWLDKVIGLGTVQLRPLSGDASFRRYFRIVAKGQSFVVMDAPPDQESCNTFVDIAGRLHAARIRAPEIVAADQEYGFLLLSDFGDRQYLQQLTAPGVGTEEVDNLYTDAMRTLSKMQRHLQAADLPYYSAEQLTGEMQLFRKWLLQEYLALDGAVMIKILDEVFDLLTDNALAQPQVFTHGDYHSRNIMDCRPDDPGILDFQDARRGPFTYDLVSLLKDCYVKWPRLWINDRVCYYFEQFCRSYADVDRRVFLRWFDLMGVQRHLKAAGIFARLYIRDDKAGYLPDIPRTLSYITDLYDDYPELRSLIELINNRVMPAVNKVYR